MKTGARHALLAAALLLSFSLAGLSTCQQVAAPVAPKILFPANGACFDADSQILLQAQSVDPASLSWQSNLQGALGTGDNLVVQLKPGKHRITCQDSSGLCSRISVQITVTSVVQGEWFQRSINGTSQVFYPEAGEYLPLLVNLASSSLTVTVGAAQTKSVVASGLTAGHTLNGSGRMYARMPFRSTFRKRVELLAPTPSSVGDKRQFHLADTTGSGQGTVCWATLQRVGSHVRVWVDNSGTMDSATLDELVNETDVYIIPRLNTFWGTIPDTDGDGTVAILITPLIDTMGNAIGFFNPADFFALDENPSSPTYNPDSNEMDILYVASPVVGDPSSPYSLDSIKATIAHELTHMIQFGYHTLPYVTPQTTNPPLQEVFLDEGFAHLSESLCGYGVSGGNVAFAACYLQSTWQYSLGVDPQSEDSVGQRGGMALFLSWLFWKNGGAEWNTDGSITDTGGPTFLRKLLQSPLDGWTSIQAATGMSMKDILIEYGKETAEMLEGLRPKPQVVVDPVHNQPVSLEPFLGICQTLGTTVDLEGPVAPSEAKIPFCAFGLVWAPPGSITAAGLQVTTDSPATFVMLEGLRVR